MVAPPKKDEKEVIPPKRMLKMVEKDLNDVKWDNVKL